VSKTHISPPAASPAAFGALSWRLGAGPVIWVLLVVAVASFAGDYWAGLGATVGLTALLALGMVLVTGYAGQFSLAVGAFYGIGAYGSAMLTINLGLPGLLALVLSSLLAALIAMLLGRPIFRLRGHFLAMGTLALTEIFYLLVNNLEITGGSSGIGGIMPLSILGLDFISTDQFFILNWLIVGVVLWGCLRLSTGREGRALKAIRGHEAAAAAVGINIASSKARIFTASAVISSIAGSLYAHQVMYVNPGPFGVETAIAILVIAVLGGMRSPWGAIVGAIALEALNQMIEAYLPGLMGAAAVGAGQTLILGLLMVVILIIRPDGIAGLAASLAASIRHRRNGARPAEGTTTAAHVDEDDDFATMAQLRETDDAQRTQTVNTRGALVLNAANLTKRFGGVTAVDDVSLELFAGEVLAVIGPNGAGKSTLVNLLSGNLPPTAGTVALNGTNVSGKAAFLVARHGLSRTFQTPCLFDGMDVASTVKVGAHLRGKVGMLRSALPTPGSVQEERRLAAETATLLERLGLSQLADQDAKNLSLGQQKQIEIARALAGRPQVLLLDEPCAGLNKGEKKKLMLLLRQLGAEGMAVLVIEHDMEFVMASADRVQVLNFGATLRIGSPAEVQADQAVIDAYLGVPSEQEDPKIGASK
jgi:ABC-type branched-subunit amino acid transport system ATPase component/ABC-type branched-subunit amino acid transport system permease subunit